MGPREDLGRRRAEVLEPERHLVLDPVEDDLVLRVLEERRHRARELGRPLQSRVAAGHLHLAGETPAVEVRDEAGERAQERRLPRAGGPQESDDVARLELEGHCVERGLGPVRIGEADRARLGLEPQGSDQDERRSDGERSVVEPGPRWARRASSPGRP